MPESDLESGINAAIERYDSGRDVFINCFEDCWGLLSESNVDAWLDLMPAEFVAEMQNRITNSPTTDAGWDDLKWFYIGGAPMQDRGPKDNPQHTASERYRVDLLRRHLSRQRGQPT